MPERSFGRTIRYRRSKLGLSQARLGELVGRSASAIRSWERDKSIPTDADVLHTLSAVLGVDERSLFEKAGQQVPPNEEASPTLEQALASLAPDDVGSSIEQNDVDDEPEGIGPDDVGRIEEETVTSQPGIESETAPTVVVSSQPSPGYVKPPQPYVVTPPTPRFVEPSYIEDSNQRQLYRVRNLATLVVVVGLVVALIWALSESLGALGSWWDDFFGSLRL